MIWPVVPLCDRQRLDVREEDVLENGLYRKCNTYRGGGGYDKFAEIYEKRFGQSINPTHFVVQLYGCPLHCPYCYVTEEGIYGQPIEITTEELLRAYKKTGLDVFHLMGGAPALYLNQWRDIANQVSVFHSDFLLVEHKYKLEHLINLPGLHAVSLKENYLYSDYHKKLMWYNLETLIYCGVNFYITFTGKDEFSQEIELKYGPRILKDSFTIPIMNYEALK